MHRARLFAAAYANALAASVSAQCARTPRCSVLMKIEKSYGCSTARLKCEAPMTSPLWM